jgi:small subunit ribosomal protein S4
VNGGIVNVPSYSLRPGDVIEVREKSKALEAITDSLKANAGSYEWLEFSSDSLKGTFVAIPERAQIPEAIKEQLIVELYSK